MTLKAKTLGFKAPQALFSLGVASSLLVAMATVQTAEAGSSERPDQARLEAALERNGIDLNDITSQKTYAHRVFVGSGQASDEPTHWNHYFRLQSCDNQGYVIARQSRHGHVTTVYTEGNCQVPGLS
ncbi:hypothetical protein [Kiloniella sp. b19]|uniref:hypothetical protein n=1 Tax=Kiloniella sp. GXU_MW_B19 TaxID=3141326 RepID=UPI0031D704BD